MASQVPTAAAPLASGASSERRGPGRPGSCQRCGGEPPTFVVTAESGAVLADWYFARLCLICARGVLSDVHHGGPYTERVTLRFESVDVL